MKIIATIDFSTTSESILKHTEIYAKAFDAEVFLVHAEPETITDDFEEMDHTPEAVMLKKDARSLEKAGVKVTPLFLQGSVCEAILNEARRLEANLIIIGAHGHGSTRCKASVGDISECVLLRSRIPVLIIPAEH
ncbi:MAG: universal stress protein [Kiritimatiellales bacterium]|nr:universal stress protein [Kiritimatiellota bacterium]MBL7011880.1 universal stress protein [Kiritimatiellales bacterium]